jgi:hypothetical protein
MENQLVLAALADPLAETGSVYKIDCNGWG